MIRFKSCIKSFIYFYGIELPEEFSDRNKQWSKRFIKWLENIPMKKESGQQSLKILIEEARPLKELIKCANKNIKLLVDSENYKERVKLIKTIPGIGLINAMFILTEVEDINRFPNAERFASFIGLIPIDTLKRRKGKSRRNYIPIT